MFGAYSSTQLGTSISKIIRLLFVFFIVVTLLAQSSPFPAEGQYLETGQNLYTYHTYDSLKSDLESLANNYADIAKLESLGKTDQGKDIWAIKISDNASTIENEQRLLFTGAHHAREWISVEVPYLLTKYLLDNYNSDPIVTALVNNLEIWIVPMLNPDGHEHSQTVRCWRKNRHDNGIPWRWIDDGCPDGTNQPASSGWGVDLNRNYGGPDYCQAGASQNPMRDTYCGSDEFSEKETSEIKNLMNEFNFVGVISYHSFSQLILFPWGYTRDPMPSQDYNFMFGLGNQLKVAIESVQNHAVYTVKQSAQLYPASGVLEDWVYSQFGIPVFTIELRPTENDPRGFDLPPDEIEPTWLENLPAALHMLQTFNPQLRSPSTSHPVYAGPADQPGKINITIDGVWRDRTVNDFSIKIGGLDALILSALRLPEMNISGSVQNGYVLQVQAPIQSTNGLFDLEVQMGDAVTTQSDAVIYREESNVDVVLVIDRSGSMSGQKIEDAKNSAKQFVGLVKDGDQIGVVSFSSTSVLDFPLTLIQPPQPNFYLDDFEGQINWTTEGLWHLVGNSPCTAPDPGYTSATHAFYYGQDATCNYDTGSSNLGSIVMTNDVLIPADYPNATLKFSTWEQTEGGSVYDSRVVYISSDGGTVWTEIWRSSTPLDDWMTTFVPIDSYAGQNVLFRFAFDTVDAIGNSQVGWLVDDIEIVSGGDIRSLAQNAIDAIYATGGTSIGAGLQTALDELSNKGDPAHPWSIVLLSDGMENTAPYVVDVLPAIISMGIKVHTIGLGSDADEALLQNIATQTGGTYHFAPTSADLSDIYNLISAAVSGQQTLFSQTSTITLGQTDQTTTFVDSSISEVTFSITWGGSDLDLTLTAPDGTLIDPTFANTDPMIDFSTGATYEFYRIQNPIAGSWALNILGVDVDPIYPEVYNIRGVADSNLFMDMYLGSSGFTQGEIQIVTSLVDNQPVTGATVITTIYPPGGTPTETLSLYDDGQHMDGAVGDGFYANQFYNNTQSGSYEFKTEATGQNNLNEPFHRETIQSLYLAETPQISVDITPPSDVSGLPGVSVTHVFTITNTGSQGDTFSLSYGPVENEQWGDLSSVLKSVYLPAGTNIQVPINVNIPDSSNISPSNELSLTAVSDMHPSIRDSASVTTLAILPNADLWTDIEGSESAHPGSRLEFVITYGNSGPDQADDIIQAIELPDGMVYVDDTLGGAFTMPDGSIGWAISSLMSGEVNNFTVEIDIDNQISEDSLILRGGIISGITQQGNTLITADPEPTNNSFAHIVHMPRRIYLPMTIK